MELHTEIKYYTSHFMLLNCVHLTPLMYADVSIVNFHPFVVALRLSAARR